jgi:solute carrier family 26 (sodium-independent sulfate anion transporter), member 11
LPHLKAIILDFSTVNRVDLTAIQNLIDTRNQLDIYAAPRSVQWHFACIQNRWTKRALAAAKFGYPSLDESGNGAHRWKSIYSVADTTGNLDKFLIDDDDTQLPRKGKGVDQDVEMKEVGNLNSEITMSVTEQQNIVGEEKKSLKVAAVHSVNRPYFHVDVDNALRSAILHEELRDIPDVSG